MHVYILVRQRKMSIWDDTEDVPYPLYASTDKNKVIAFAKTVEEDWDQFYLSTDTLRLDHDPPYDYQEDMQFRHKLFDQLDARVV